MSLRVYADRVSQPSRAVIIFCKVNGIDFEEIRVDLMKGEQQMPEYKEINPMGQVPAIVHADFKLFESHAILSYLACAFPGVADHWYPTDLIKRAKINSALDWHHSNLRRGAAHLVGAVLAPILGFSMKEDAATEAEQILTSSLFKLESFWLEGNGKFLLGGSEPSIADISLVCELMQLEFLDEKDCKRILGPHKKVLHWIEDTRIAAGPHFEEVHEPLLQAKQNLNKLQDSRSTIRVMLSSDA